LFAFIYFLHISFGELRKFKGESKYMEDEIEKCEGCGNSNEECTCEE